MNKRGRHLSKVTQLKVTHETEGLWNTSPDIYIYKTNYSTANPKGSWAATGSVAWNFPEKKGRAVRGMLKENESDHSGGGLVKAQNWVRKWWENMNRAKEAAGTKEHCLPDNRYFFVPLSVCWERGNVIEWNKGREVGNGWLVEQVRQFNGFFFLNLQGEKPKLQEDERVWKEMAPGALWKFGVEGLPQSPWVRGLGRSEGWKVMPPP